MEETRALTFIHWVAVGWSSFDQTSQVAESLAQVHRRILSFATLPLTQEEVSNVS